MNTKEKLYQLEESGSIQYDISHRGGSYGLRAEAFINEFVPENLRNRITEEDLPAMVGCHCNYLGGGLRGSIVGGGYSESLPEAIIAIIEDYTEACKARYEEIETDSGLNSEEDENGDTNWDAIGTKSSRKAGIVSGY